MALNKNKRVLITGGTGFIGRNILESFLGKKYNFIAPTHKDLDLTKEEEVRSFFQKNKIDVVIHTAGKPAHRNAPDQTNIFYSDMQMFMNIVRNENHYKKMIILSSGAIYDINQCLSKVKEEFFGTHIPIDEHGFYRYVVGKYIELANNIIELRIFGIYGKYEDYAIRFISNSICKTIFDLPITIKQNRKFDYLYVNDLMPILDHFIENNVPYKAYNVCSGSPIELYTLAEIVKKISGKNLPIIIKEKKMGLEYSGDNSRLKEEVPNIKFTPINLAIRELYKWYVKNNNSISRELLLSDK